MVGERIRYYRKRQKMTLRELGEKSGFENRGDVRIAQYENGSRVPRTGTLNRIAKALGIPPEELFCEDCRKCMFLKNYYRKKRKSHTTFDMGIEEDNSYREHKNPEDEKFMDYMPEKFKGMELVAEPVEKVNVTLDGIILREEGRNISPTIYINDMYKKYQDCGDLEVSHH